MAVELFGFTIGRTQKEKEQQDRVSFTLPESEDGAIDVAGTPGGAYATYLDMEGSARMKQNWFYDTGLCHFFQKLKLQ